VSEAGENASLAAEPFPASRARECGIQEFHSHTAFEPAVAALGEPHATHSTASDRRDQGIGSYRLAGERSLEGGLIIFEELTRLPADHLRERQPCLGIKTQQGFDFRAQLSIYRMELKIQLALSLSQVRHFAEQLHHIVLHDVST
jgi:hypothetical protein